MGRTRADLLKMMYTGFIGISLTDDDCLFCVACFFASPDLFRGDPIPGNPDFVGVPNPS